MNAQDGNVWRISDPNRLLVRNISSRYLKEENSLPIPRRDLPQSRVRRIYDVMGRWTQVPHSNPSWVTDHLHWATLHLPVGYRHPSASTMESGVVVKGEGTSLFISLPSELLRESGRLERLLRIAEDTPSPFDLIRYPNCSAKQLELFSEI